MAMTKWRAMVVVGDNTSRVDTLALHIFPGKNHGVHHW